jgi:polyhydroxyalkanoate synthase
MIDFRDPGDMAVFIDEEQISALEVRMHEKGYLEGASMSLTFNLLRSNELIWSYYVQHYLLGQEPFPFDLLYWNCDNTNMPAAMHSFYLRKMYLENVFCKPGGVTLAGVKIDVSQITVPAMFVSTYDDHIAPWRTTYYGALLHKGATEFVLGGSGHVAGVINPPAKNKYVYWTHSQLPADPEQWLAAAKQQTGSWWPHWLAWLKSAGDELVPARQVGNNVKYPVLVPAPGDYVKNERLFTAGGVSG